MRKPLMRFETKVRLCLWKAYFDTGFSYFNYFKYFVYIWVGYDVFVRKTFVSFYLAGAGIFLISLLIGYLWYHTDFMRASTEVGNRYNLLAEELRKKFKLKRKI